MSSLNRMSQVGKRGVTLAHTAVLGVGVIALVIEICQVHFVVVGTMPQKPTRKKTDTERVVDVLYHSFVPIPKRIA